MSTRYQAPPEDLDQVLRDLLSSGDVDETEELGGNHILVVPGESVCFIPRSKAISTDKASVQLAQFAALKERALEGKDVPEVVQKAYKDGEKLLKSGSARAFPADVRGQVQVKIEARTSDSTEGAGGLLRRYYVSPSDVSIGRLVCDIALEYKRLLQDAQMWPKLRLRLASKNFTQAIIYQVVRTEALRNDMQVWEAHVAHDIGVDDILALDRVLAGERR